jgi:protein-S-isoprenylcysteine O-methyltransferase
MTSVRILWLLLCLLWIGAEITLVGKSRRNSQTISESEEQSQRVLWLTISASLVAALYFKSMAWVPIPVAYLPRQMAALLVFITGLYFRYAAVIRLGRFFTTNVSIQIEHELITDGPYRWVRHPSYTGVLLALAAAGIAMGDCVALMLLTVPNFFAFDFRIAIEEKLLHKKFGPVYLTYSSATRKLLPWLY